MNAAPDPIVTLDSSGGRRLHEQAAELRAAGPAVKVALPEGVTAWSITRGDIVKRLLTHPDVSKDAGKHWAGYRPGAIQWLYAWTDVKSMLTADGDEHERLKQAIGGGFSRSRIQAMRPVLETIVTRLLDDLAARPGDEPVDLRAAFSYQVPTLLICDLFGVPGEQRGDMLRAIDLVLTTDITAEQAETNKHDLYRTMMALIEYKRRTPGEDLTSHLLKNDELTEVEAVSTLILMIGAGSETAVALIGWAVREMLTHPGQLAAVMADPGRWADVIEETLRLHPPIMHLPMRFAASDIPLGEDVTIPRGDAILVGYGAHGRDPAAHTDPELFDIDRADKQHLAFGFGIHHCLGAPLARLEAEVALPLLFARFPRLALADPTTTLSPQRSFMGNDVTHMPVLLGQAAGAAR
ncbi:cytochrome P450 [Streptomyces sp. CFMR 7]|uniref:cytochrome P450 family protein n=1 Tax=Streptomyces sp. CFMR 7 TaxID=1649184 RepID=UPI0011A0A0A4|nr:cytochrome P450 [Streptomyces sp. CFMR 7]